MGDPVTGLAALGLVCNVLEIVSFTTKIVSKGYEIQRSSSGELDANEALRTCALGLSRLNDPLAHSLEKYEKLPAAELDDEDKVLQDIGKRCFDEAHKLVNTLNQLRPASSLSLHRNVYYAFKAHRKENDIHDLERRMRGFQDEINAITLKSVRVRQKFMAAEQTENFALLHQQEKQTLDAINQAARQMSNQLDIKNDLLMRELMSQREEFREEFRAMRLGRSLRSTDDADDLSTSVEGDWTPVARLGTSPRREELSVFAMIEKDDLGALMSAMVRAPARVIAERDEQVRTPLHVASMLGNARIVNALVKKGASTKDEDFEGSTPLHLAAKANAAACARVLVENGADVKSKDYSSRTPIKYVMEDSEIAWILNFGYDIDLQNADGATALWIFSEKGDTATVTSLLGQGADPDISPDKAPLQIAARNGHLNIVNLLLNADASPDLRSEKTTQGTPLGDASIEGHLEVVRRLIQAGADLDGANIHGWTPLIAATEYQHEEVALLLIESGADLTCENDWRYHAIHIACMRGLKRVVQAILEKRPELVHSCGRDSWTPLSEACVFGYSEIVELLLDYGADTEMRGETDHKAGPIHRATVRGHVRPVEILLSKGGADIEARNAEGKTALHLASQRGNHAFVQRLIELGADPMSREWTRGLLRPLDWAAHVGSSELVRVLCDSRMVDVNIRSGNIGITALCRAVENGHAECVRTLLSYGADPNIKDASPKHDVEYGPGKMYPPIVVAAMKGDQATLEALVVVGKADINAQNADGYTALHEVATRGNLQSLRFLLAHGADRSLRGRLPTAQEICRADETPEWRNVEYILKHEYL